MTLTISRRHVFRLSLAVLFATGVAMPAVAQSALSVEVIRSDEPGFFKTSVLLSGERDAILIDGMFKKSDGLATVERIRASGKNLTTIFVSGGDPDYYFSLEHIRAAFPKVRIVATAETVAYIDKSHNGKVVAWSKRLGSDAPTSIIVPEAVTDTKLNLEGRSIEIITPDPDLPAVSFLWVPEIKAILGSTLVWGGLHVWTADTPKPEDRAPWLRALAAMEARAPATVVPAHKAPDFPIDATGLGFTRDYLLAFEEEAKTAKNGAELEAAMSARYPGAPLAIALNIGSKVAKGEMTWD